jgi:hypothetical protein
MLKLLAIEILIRLHCQRNSCPYYHKYKHSAAQTATRAGQVNFAFRLLTEQNFKLSAPSPCLDTRHLESWP